MTKVLAVFFAVYSVYCLWTLFYQLSPIAVLTAGLFAAAAIGLWLKRPWSRWIVYFVSTVLGGYFVWYVWAMVQTGWPFESPTRSVVALIPGLLLLMFAVGAAVHVARAFRHR